MARSTEAQATGAENGVETDSSRSLQKGPILPTPWLQPRETDFDLGTERDYIFVALSHCNCGNLLQQQ